jgi:thymidylate kinase
MDQGLLVEFVGLPGCGKSTISKTAAELLRKEGISVELSSSKRIYDLRRSHKFYRTLRSLRSLRILLNGLWIFYSIRPWNRDTLKRCLAFHKYELFNGAANSLVILDQGIVQDVYSAIYTNRIANGTSVRALWRKFVRSRIDAIVIVNCTPEEAIRRITSRVHGRSRLDRMCPDQVKSHLLIARPLLQKLALECAEEQESKILILDSAESSTANAVKIANLIKSMRHDRTGKGSSTTATSA